MTEFDDVIRLLRENRPEAGELELDQIKQRVRRQTARPERRQDMKSRLAILMMLVLGMMLSTTGAGLAIQDLATNDASVAQYGDDDTDDAGDVLGSEEGDEGAGEEAAGERDSGGLQPARQVESGADTGELPFTGFLALPILLGGVALLTGGLVLRRRTGDRD
jgi:hypothetical protein